MLARLERMSGVEVCLEESCEVFPLLLVLAFLIFVISKSSIDFIWTLEVFGFLEDPEIWHCCFLAI